MENLYSVKSLYVAAYLINKGFEAKEVTEKNGKVLFWFEKSESMFDIIKEYRENENLKGFIGKLHEVKKMVWKKKKEVEALRMLHFA